MAENDPQTTQRDVALDIAGELVGAGFSEPDLIGQGGFGAVYRCSQPGLDRIVAVKVLTDHLDEGNLERFVREQRAMGRLSGHPNIVDILEVGCTPGGHPYIVMPFHPHDSLDARIRKHGPLQWQDVLRLGVKVAGALETAHRSGTLHRDVKPGNILLTEYGEPQLTDFGIARISGGFETASDIVTGSPAFTAPELLAGASPTVASEIYGLGATLFCALTGHAAFERRDGEQVVTHFLRVAAEPMPDLSENGIPGPLSRAVEWAMARDPRDRPASVAEYGEALREVQRRLGVVVDEIPLPLGRTDDPLAGGGERRARTGIVTAPVMPSTKFRTPLRPRAQVPRARLLEILGTGEGRRLVLIHAPAGYGKTTVATQWAEKLMESEVAVAWLTVDDEDNDVARFLSNVIDALGRVNPVIVGDLAEVIEEHGAKAEQYVLTSLINEIHARHERMAIIIEDWHRVTDVAVIEAMDFLIERGCHHLQVVITSRSRSGLPVSRMRVRDELVEIDTAELCFDPAETRSFLADVAGLDLGSEEVADLWSATDGWVAALQLVCLSLRGAKSPAELISHISGRHHAIGDFLAENVLSTLEPEMLHFLLAVSLPDRICAGLATALTGRQRAHALLEEVEARDLFLRRVDQDGDWFRFNPLFGEFLRRRLEYERPEEIPSLHEAASAWYAEQGMLVEAVDHALAGGDTDRAVSLVTADGQTLIEHSHMTKLLALVEKLPAAEVAGSPRLQLLLAWSNLSLHRIRSAYAALERMSAVLAKLPDTQAGVTEIRLAADVATACIGAISDRVEQIDDLIAESVSRPDTLPPFVVSAAANAAAVSATFRFDFDEAHRWQAWAMPYHQQGVGPLPAVYGHAFDGIAAFEQLDLDRAEQSFARAFQISMGTGSSIQSMGSRVACALLAEVRYERGDVAEAGRLLDASFKLGADEGVVDMIKARYVIGARVALLHGDREAAGKLLDEALDIAERLDTPRLRAFIESEQLIWHLPCRNEIRARVDHAGRAHAPVGMAAVIAQLDEENSIRLLLDESGDPGASGNCHLACSWAREWVDRLEGTGRERAALRAERLLATALSAAGRSEEAERQALAVLARCARAGMVRYPLDGGEIFRALVDQVRSDLTDGGYLEAPGVSMSFLDDVVEGL